MKVSELKKISPDATDKNVHKPMNQDDEKELLARSVVELREDLLALAKHIEKHLVKASDFITHGNSISERLDHIESRLMAVCDKLDSEDVANLDTDYRSTVDAM